MRKTCKLFIMTFLILSIASVFNASAVSAYTYTFRAYIDGESELLIRGNTVQWHNLQWDVPGITSDDGGQTYNYPTTITTVDMETVDWYPLWAGGTDGVQYSDIYDGLNQSLPSDGPITLTVIEQREEGMVSIFQMPDISNNYTLIVNFDDAVPSGATWYEIELNTANPVPLPGAIWLLGSGLIGLVGFGRKNRNNSVGI